ncbi:hypothetical protein [Parashewanella tropica]|uniref:hypothetical protein n=1 Tax=Parashewanella tropica TaxID=2547970 RepID=UPI00105A101D|nr:hypothetical protein [Parashewanella tropica]
MLDKFLAQLGEDTELLESYQKAPKEVMEEYGLSEDDITAMLSADEQKLKERAPHRSPTHLLFVHQPNDEK